MVNIQFLIQKLVGFIVLLIAYIIILYFLAPGLFTDNYVVFALIIFFTYLFIEQMYKIEPPENYKMQQQDIIILLVFFCYPLLSALSFYEREMIIIPFLPFWNEPTVKIFGILVLLIGAITTFLSRLQLGKHGTSIIFVYDDHKLINTGIYNYIRHPIYLGALIQYTSMGVIIGSIFITLITFILWILIVNTRIKLEEALLLEKFGDEYRQYQKQTKKLIPFLY